MIQQIRKIGNSSGIIIPKPMLDKCRISENVSLEIVEDMIIIKPLNKKPRENWDLMFKEANAGNEEIEENYFEGVTNEFDIDEW
jgi:antitoxin MazE